MNPVQPCKPNPCYAHDLLHPSLSQELVRGAYGASGNPWSLVPLRFISSAWFQSECSLLVHQGQQTSLRTICNHLQPSSRIIFYKPLTNNQQLQQLIVIVITSVCRSALPRRWRPVKMPSCQRRSWQKLPVRQWFCRVKRPSLGHDGVVLVE